MTEHAWQTGHDPRPMLEFLRGMATDRKLRLLAAGAVRHFWGLLLDPASQEAVSLAELAADVGGVADRLDAARRHAWDVLPLLSTGRMAHVSAARAAGRAAEPDALRASELVMNEIIGLHADLKEERARSDAEEYDLYWEGKARGERFLAELLRDLWGNPFRSMTLDSLWLSPTAFSLAQTIYEGRNFDRLPVLAEALEDAGCDQGELLAHCRSETPHARGCWVLDSIRGRE